MIAHEEFKELVKERNYTIEEILYILNMIDETKMSQIVSYLKGNYDK